MSYSTPSWMLTSCDGAKTPHELSTSHARHHHYKLYCFFFLFHSGATNYLDHLRCSEEIWHLFLTTGQTQRRNPLHSSWRNVLHIKWALYAYQLPWIISFKIQTSPADDILILSVVWCDDVLSSSSEKKILCSTAITRYPSTATYLWALATTTSPAFTLHDLKLLYVVVGWVQKVVHMPKEGRKPQLFIPHATSSSSNFPMRREFGECRRRHLIAKRACLSHCCRYTPIYFLRKWMNPQSSTDRKLSHVSDGTHHDTSLQIGSSAGLISEQYRTVCKPPSSCNLCAMLLGWCL